MVVVRHTRVVVACGVVGVVVARGVVDVALAAGEVLSQVSKISQRSTSSVVVSSLAKSPSYVSSSWEAINSALSANNTIINNPLEAAMMTPLALTVKRKMNFKREMRFILQSLLLEIPLRVMGNHV